MVYDLDQRNNQVLRDTITYLYSLSTVICGYDYLVTSQRSSGEIHIGIPGMRKLVYLIGRSRLVRSTEQSHGLDIERYYQGEKPERFGPPEEYKEGHHSLGHHATKGGRGGRSPGTMMRNLPRRGKFSKQDCAGSTMGGNIDNRRYRRFAEMIP